MSAPSNAPIGKFEADIEGEWIETGPALTENTTPVVLKGYRFRPNTYLKDAEGEYIYEGDSVYSTKTKQWYTVYRIPSGTWVLMKPNWLYDGAYCCEVWSAAEYLTHTPPKKKYKRKMKCYSKHDNVWFDDTETVENQRVGKADRRAKQIGFDDFSASLLDRVPKGKSRGQKRDRRTGEGE